MVLFVIFGRLSMNSVVSENRRSTSFYPLLISQYIHKTPHSEENRVVSLAHTFLPKSSIWFAVPEKCSHLLEYAEQC